MNDYAPLMKANDICKRSGYSFSYFFGGKDVYKNFGKQNIADHCILYGLDSGPIIGEFETAQELLAFLTELVDKKPKYEIGQEVWWVEMGCLIHCFNIQSMFFNELSEWEYDNVPESELYTSKQELIDAQINYWREQMDVRSVKNG